MKRTISRVILLTMILYLCLPIANCVYAKENISVAVNGVSIEENAHIETVGEKLYVSARSVANPMGLNLEWNDAKKTLMISHQDKIITLVVAMNVAIVDNTPIVTEQPLKIVSNRSVIDLGFVCEVFGATMTFNEDKNVYEISIDVPEDFQPDTIKNKTDELILFGNTEPELAKVRDIANDLGLEVAWEDEARAVTLMSEYGDTLTLYANHHIAWFNGKEIDCPVPLEIIDDTSYIEYGFVEELFNLKIPENYLPARQIASELGLNVEWADDTRNVIFTSSDGDVLSIPADSGYYILNDELRSNSAPLIIADGVSWTDKTVVYKALFESDAAEDTLELFASDKTFSGNLILEKTFNSDTYIDVTVISVQSIVYNNDYGFVYSDYNTERIEIPAKTRMVPFSVAKRNWDPNDSYIIGYSFPNSNDYYYDSGYLSNSNGIVTSLNNYYYYCEIFDRYSTTTNIKISPKYYYDVQLDDVVFTGTIKTNDDIYFGTGSSLNVSVRSATYYGETVLASVTLTPGEVSSKSFSISVPNTLSTRNTPLYLCYSYDGENENIVRYDYYANSTTSVKSYTKAKKWYISSDVLDNINFAVISKQKKTLDGTFYLQSDTKLEKNRDVYIGLDIMTVHSDVYSQKTLYPYESYDNVACIKQGETYANYSLAVSLEDSESYVLRYRITSLCPNLSPYGYANSGESTTNLNHATVYTAYSDLQGVDFWIPNSSNHYKYINNMPYSNFDRISDTLDSTSRNTYYKGYYIYLTEGETVTIKLLSSDFDAYLYMLDENMSVIAYNDDGLTSGNAKITKQIKKSGYYYIQATTYSAGDIGKYTLKINTDKPLSGGAYFTDADYNNISSVDTESLITANYKIENTETSSRYVNLYMALYDKNNVLLGAKTKRVKVTGLLDTESLTLDLKQYKNVDYVKSFVWTDKLIPIGNSDCLYKD